MLIANSKQKAIEQKTSFFYHNKKCNQKHDSIWRWRKIKNSTSVQIECRQCAIERTKKFKEERGLNLRKNRASENVNRCKANERNKRYEEKLKLRRLENIEFDIIYKRKMNAKGMYRYTKKMQATPTWVDRKALEKIYLNCPEGYEVDHIIPLRGKNVSGLHVPWNLQYLTKEENLKKSNKVLL